MAENDVLKSHTRLSGSRNTGSLSTITLCSRYVREFKRRSVNKATVLLLCYSIPAFCCLFVIKTIALGLLIPIQRSNCLEVVQTLVDQDYSKYVLRTMQTTITYISFPLMGWIAEVCIGRTRIMTFSIYSMWFGMVIETLTNALQFSMCGLPFNLVKYSGTLIGLIFLILGTASFFANLPAYILEQMMSEPSDKLRSSVNWLSLSLFMGITVQYLSLPHDIPHENYTKKAGLAISILVTVMCTVVVIVHQHCCDHFIQIGTMQKNPSKLIWNIVRYAYKQPRHKRRSALSYWDKVIPSKFDVAKDKYGGPFSEDEVEDVKSFWSVFFVLCSLIGFYIPFSAISDDGMIYISMFKDSSKFIDSHILMAIITGFFIFLIPLLELFLIPCCPRVDYLLQNSLRGLGLSFVLFLVSLILLITLDVIGQYSLDFHSSCYLDDKTLKFNVSFLWYTGPFFIFCCADLLNFVFSVQFIMSQAPLRMCGLLTGLYWLLRAFGSNLAVIIKIPFDIQKLSNQLVPACSFWILLIHSLICMISILCFIKVARKYQKRKKNVAYLGKEIVEEYYERLLNESDGDLSYPPFLTKSSDYFTYEATIQNKTILTIN